MKEQTRRSHRVFVNAYVLTLLTTCCLNKPDPPARVRLRVTLDAKTYTLGNAMRVTLEFRNKGTKPVFFYPEYSWGAPGYLDFSVLDSKSRPLKRRLFMDGWQFEAIRGPDKNRLIQLEPNETTSYSKVFDLPNLVAEPGEYTLKIKYEPRMEWEWHKGRRVWGSRAGPLIASADLKLTP